MITIFCERFLKFNLHRLRHVIAVATLSWVSQCHGTFKCAAICPHLFTSIFRVFPDREESIFSPWWNRRGKTNGSKKKSKSNPSRDVVQAGSHRQTYPKHVYLTWDSLSGQINLSQRLYGKNGIDIAHCLGMLHTSSIHLFVLLCGIFIAGTCVVGRGNFS